MKKTKFVPFLSGSILLLSGLLTFVPLETSASTFVYTDVDKKNSHYENIYAAREANILIGYPGDKFMPHRQLTRGNVVKALGKYVLESEGKTLDTYDVSGVIPFKDVQKNYHDYELYQLSLVVKKAGIFKGANGYLNPTDLIQRQQMAQVLVNAFELKDLPNKTSAVTDNNKAFAWNREPIDILSENGVTNVSNFRPSDYTNRGQFASFLIRSLDAMSSDIISIKAIEISRKLGEELSLPETVVVTLENGTETERKVTWHTSDLDLTQPGTQSIEGTVEGTSLEPKLSLTLEAEDPKISEIVSIDPLQVRGELNKALNLPATVTVTRENGSKTEEKVTWNTTGLDLTKPGTHTVDGTVEGTSIKAELSLTLTEADTEAPLLHYDGPTFIDVPFNAEYALPKVVATDNVDKEVEVTHSIVFSDGFPDKVDTSKSGTYIVTFSATDSSGNEAESITIFVKVGEDVVGSKIKAAEKAIAILPEADQLKTVDAEAVKKARQLVQVAYDADPKAQIKGIDKLSAAEKQMEELLKADRIAQAEQAIAKLPEADSLTLDDQTAVLKARELVDFAAKEHGNVTIRGIKKLTDAEAVIERLAKEQRIKEYVENAEQAISKLPAAEFVTIMDRPRVKQARSYVNAALTEDPNVSINGIELLEAAEKRLAEFGPEVHTHSYASITVNNLIRSISTSIQNTSNQDITIEKVEVLVNDNVNNTYTKEYLDERGFETEISPYQSFSMSITYNIGLWTNDKNVVRYTISDGPKTFVHDSLVN